MFDLSPDDITEGPVLRAMLVLAAPLLVQNLVQVVQQVVDLFWLGRLSDAAVSAIGLTLPLITLLFALTVYVPLVGTQILVSQRVGTDDVVGARRAMFTGLFVASVSAVVGGAVVFFGARPMLETLTLVRPSASGEAAALELAATYVRVTALGLPLLLLSDTTEGAFLGWGDSKTAMRMNVIAVVVNVVLDPVLIFGVTLGGVEFAGLGIAGAALATVVGYTVGGSYGYVRVARGAHGGMLSRATATVDWGEVREMFDVGGPIAGQNVVKQVADVLLVTVAFAVGGAPALAAWAVGFRVASLAVIPATGMQQAAQSVIGQNLGAGYVGRAHRATWQGAILAAVGLGVLGVVQWFLPGLIIETFAPTLSARGSEFTALYLRILAVGYPAMGAMYLFQAGFNGASRTRTSFVASLGQHWGVRVPVAVLGSGVLGTLAVGFGIAAVFWAVTLSNVAAAVGLGLYYYYSTERGMLDRAAEAAAA
ncbi:MATE family efflux transporter [Halomarina oriensis]|uniref:Multidrug-efflux transporter n=1 Tax=Halomarina oriensis TaxID=671145 RepID=A0A6B0GJZ7_9EURY|nr:MATE family efflux transporter [Halomarina oriensis]MWG34920.1 MATE family efflux transporter [Halomarina oriensis]